jgi:undecaprenyl-diphosphatase
LEKEDDKGVIARFDTAVMLFIQNDLRCDALDAVWSFFKTRRLGFFWLCFPPSFLRCRNTGKRTFMLFSVAVGWIASDVFIKNIVARPRPFEVMTGYRSSWMAGVILVSVGHACAGFPGVFAFKERGGMCALHYMPAALIALSRHMSACIL